MWNLPGSCIRPVSPALAGGFFTTEPPGRLFSVLRSLMLFLWTRIFQPQRGSWLQLEASTLAMNANCCPLTCTICGAFRDPLDREGHTRECWAREGSSLERKALSNCWTNSQGLCLTKCHLSQLIFGISFSKKKTVLS